MFAFFAEMLYDTWFVKEGVPFLYKIVLIELSMAFLTNVILNFYWSYLIIRVSAAYDHGKGRQDF